MSGIDPRSFAPANVDWSITLADQIAFWKSYLELNPEAIATIDFETRSACNLRKRGSWRYARDASTEAMCLAYLLPNTTKVELWHAAHPDFFIAESPKPLSLFAFILAGGLVEAHNVFFERVIWYHIMHLKHGWPAIDPRQLRCSASKCSAHALPRDLGNASMAMNLDVQKDAVGRTLMMKMSRPRKPRKAEKEEWQLKHGSKTPMPILFHETEEDLERLWAYCVRDVETEHLLSLSVPPLSPFELMVWQMDQDMNWRGAKFDVTLAKAALKLAERYKSKLNGELEIMTGIESATKRAQVTEWLIQHEQLELPDTAKDTIDWYLTKEEISGRARRILEIMKEVNRTSTRKYAAILEYADDDDCRIRDLLMYHGAGTGRWAGKGVQVQNFPKGEFDDLDMDEACQWIIDGELEWIEALYGDVMSFLSATLRGAIIPEDGRDFMVADYSAIEARCVLWLADAFGALDVFRRGEDIYCDMATGIYGRKITKKDKAERQFGKQAVLGLGYGMGFITFLLTCRKYKIYFSKAQVMAILGPEKYEEHTQWIYNHLRLGGDRMPEGMAEADIKKWRAQSKVAAIARRRITDARENPKAILHELALMRYTVQVYRARYPEVKDMWTAQETAACQAVIQALATPIGTEGPTIKCGKVEWFVTANRKFLHCRLPSGRLLSYVDPSVKTVATPWGERRPALRYMRMGMANKWESTATYGGKFVENITQAVARDIMAHAMVDAWLDSPYDTIASIHDELVCEVDKDKGDLKEFEDLMADIPVWAMGCPITAEADRFFRYRK